MKNNRYIYRVASVFLLLFVGVIAYMGYFTVVESKKLIVNPYNKRLDHLESEVVRGDILDTNGEVLATSKNGKREYPYGKTYAHAVGYVGHDKAGVEARANVELLYPNYTLRSLFAFAFTDEKFKGHDVYLTLDHKLQQASREGLGDYQGAVVAIEPGTGKIKALYSNPGFNPNTVGENWGSLVEDTNSSVLLNRATQGLYPPGSTFKILTTIAYLEQLGEGAFNYEYDCKGMISKNGYEIKCINGKAHGVVNLESAFIKSCNTYFISLSDQVSPQALGKVATDLLFNRALGAQIDYKASVFKLTDESDAFNKLATYMGQGETLMSPLHLAMVASIIYNDGVLMSPYIVDYSVNTKGKIELKNLPQYEGTYLDESLCRTLKDLMIKVVEEGTGNRVYRSDMTIGGKTGTAQNETGGDHSLFVGFAEDKDGEKESIVFAVVVEQGGKGSKALDVTRTLLEAYKDE
ncbi:MAG: penicillin-binding transpeptidase domain-containing protein [Niameybacter sp.]|uniref:penicillin-binding transpeptidase domain-containing protein n=1 Tax=Niameybacter sp. TaxID=2033640 RepID=UPI002FC890B9